MSDWAMCRAEGKASRGLSGVSVRIKKPHWDSHASLHEPCNGSIRGVFFDDVVKTVDDFSMQMCVTTKRNCSFNLNMDDRLTFTGLNDRLKPHLKKVAEEYSKFTGIPLLAFVHCAEDASDRLDEPERHNLDVQTGYVGSPRKTVTPAPLSVGTLGKDRLPPEIITRFGKDEDFEYWGMDHSYRASSSPEKTTNTTTVEVNIGEEDKARRTEPVRRFEEMMEPYEPIEREEDEESVVDDMGFGVFDDDYWAPPKPKGNMVVLPELYGDISNVIDEEYLSFDEDDDEEGAAGGTPRRTPARPKTPGGTQGGTPLTRLLYKHKSVAEYNNYIESEMDKISRLEEEEEEDADDDQEQRKKRQAPAKARPNQELEEPINSSVGRVTVFLPPMTSFYTDDQNLLTSLGLGKNTLSTWMCPDFASRGQSVQVYGFRNDSYVVATHVSGLLRKADTIIKDGYQEEFEKSETGVVVADPNAAPLTTPQRITLAKERTRRRKRLANKMTFECALIPREVFYIASKDGGERDIPLTAKAVKIELERCIDKSALFFGLKENFIRCFISKRTPETLEIVNEVYDDIAFGLRFCREVSDFVELPPNGNVWLSDQSSQIKRLIFSTSVKDPFDGKYPVLVIAKGQGEAKSHIGRIGYAPVLCVLNSQNSCGSSVPTKFETDGAALNVTFLSRELKPITFSKTYSIFVDVKFERNPKKRGRDDDDDDHRVNAKNSRWYDGGKGAQQIRHLRNLIEELGGKIIL